MIILIGESGSGKTTILNELAKRGYQKARNHTTRQKRMEEEQLGEYHFISKEQFEQMWNEGQLLQRAEFNHEFYGIGMDSLKDNVVCIAIVDSLKDIKNRVKELNRKDVKIISFYIHVSANERTKRMLKRGDSIESIQKRLSIDKEKFKQANQVVDYVVENDDLEETVNEIIKLTKSNDQKG